MSAKKGFTLIEILVVLVMIAILVAIALPNYQLYVQQSNARHVATNLGLIYQAEKNYYLSNGHYCLASTAGSGSAFCGDTISDLVLPGNLNLNITDTRYKYSCLILRLRTDPAGNTGLTCSASQIGATHDPALTIDVYNPVVACTSTHNYCPPEIPFY